MKKPVAVIISDVHYSLPTLKLADQAMRMAITKANELQVTLIVAGDLHDTKANLRGECVNAMLETFALLKSRECFILRGNHDAINEKSEQHSLNFLGSLAKIIVKPGKYSMSVDMAYLNPVLIPYQHDITELKRFVDSIDPNELIIMHQGIHGSNMGDYVQDKTAIDHSLVAGHRVISGHYHARQTIKLPNSGVWDYIGNPYTFSYGEANDPPKGFQVLYDDNTLEFIPTNLRRHIIYECEANSLSVLAVPKTNPGDLLWIKVSDTKENLQWATRKNVARYGLLDDFPFKLTHHPTDIETDITYRKETGSELLDTLINTLDTSDSRKSTLKQLWRDNK